MAAFVVVLGELALLAAKVGRQVRGDRRHAVTGLKIIVELSVAGSIPAATLVLSLNPEPLGTARMIADQSGGGRDSQSILRTRMTWPGFWRWAVASVADSMPRSPHIGGNGC